MRMLFAAVLARRDADGGVTEAIVGPGLVCREIGI
jgi:hypothetical protein